MAYTTKFNPWTKTLQWINDTLTAAWADITGKPSWVAGTEESFTTTLKNKLDAVVDPLIYKGVIDCNASPNYPAASVGHVYIVSVAGKIGGVSGPNVEINDSLICKTTTIAGNHATVGANWNIVQANLDGAVIGPTSSVSANVVEFDGITGQLIKDGGLAHTDVSDAVSKKHSQGTDQGLDTGGANAVTAAQAKAGYTHSTTSHAPSDAVSLTTVKADSDVSSAISSKHTQNTDQYLDYGGENQVGVSDVKTAVTNNHTHSNKSTLDNTQEAFTTALKNHLDGIEANADVTDATNVASAIVGATGKDTPIDADSFGLINSAASNALNNLTWANVKVTLKSYFDGIYKAIGTYLSNISEDTTPELGGELNAGAHTIGFTEQAITSTSGEATIDWKLSNKAAITLSENVTTFTWTAPSYKCNLQLRIIQNATPKTIAWPNTTRPTGFNPSLAVASAVYLVGIYYDGTNYLCQISENMA